MARNFVAHSMMLLASLIKMFHFHSRQNFLYNFFSVHFLYFRILDLTLKASFMEQTNIHAYIEMKKNISDLGQEIHNHIYNHLTN